jgi:hypothetical protein
VENHGQCYQCIECDCYDYLLAAHWNCFAEFVFESLHSGVSVANEIGNGGAKAVGDALKDNTTLSSLSLNLQGEFFFFVECLEFCAHIAGRLTDSLFPQLLKRTA